MKKGVKIVSAVLGIVGGAAAYLGYSKHKKDKDELNAYKVGNARTNQYYKVIQEWLALKQRGGDIAEYFDKTGYNKIAIYGMGSLGWLFYDDIKNTDINIVYAFDKNAETMGNPIETKLDTDIEKGITDVDAIVVTPIADYFEIKEYIERYTNIPVVSLEDIINLRF